MTSLRALAMLSIIGLATPVFASPAAEFCDGLGGSSRSEQARRLIRFHQILNDALTLEAGHQECVEREMQPALVEAHKYCAERDEHGHDLRIDQLGTLDHALFNVWSTCSGEEHERQRAQIEKIIPKKCSDLEPSFRAVLALADPSLSLACAQQVYPPVARELAQKCAAGDLSVRGAFVELNERVGELCPVQGE